MNLIPRRNKGIEKDAEEPLASSPMARFRAEMDRLFERFFSDPWGMTTDLFTPGRGWAPTLDVAETDQEITVRAEVPGVDPENLDISLSGHMLVISGEKKESSEREEENIYHAERRFGSFRRSVPLPTSVDTDKISAEHKDGILTIHLPKVEAARPKKITIKPK
ncbi:MAG TPA: Hsp20/alpha crystallin family protein [Phycisphaerae bacterium]|nr:Hsp20/alpha crystallin family protein [Phycisphaerae bacterium]